MSAIAVTLSGSNRAVIQADDFRQAGGVSADDRGAAGHGLKRWQTEAFMPGGEDEELAEIVEVDEFFIRHIAGKALDHAA